MNPGEKELSAEEKMKLHLAAGAEGGAPSDTAQSMTPVLPPLRPEDVDLATAIPEDQVTDEGLKIIMQTDWYKSQPEQVKAFIRMGGNPDTVIAELERAVVDSQIASIEEINLLRKQEGKEAIDKEAFQSQSYIQEDEDAISTAAEEAESDLLKQFQAAEGTDENGEDEDDVFSDIEKRLNNSLIVEPDNAVKSFDENTSVLDVKVKRNGQYEEAVRGMLEDNSIKIKSTDKGNLKDAAIRNYTNRTNHVTTPLVNSGIFVTLSGGSATEVMAMSQIQADTRVQIEIKKMNAIHKHLVDSTFGDKVLMANLMKVIHYRDLQTLFYNFFVGTFPEEVDYPVNCLNPKCGQDIILKIHASDMVLNADEFKDQIQQILYTNMSLDEAMKATPLSKVHQFRMNDGTIVGVRIPSLYDQLEVMNKIEQYIAKDRTADESKINLLFGYLMYVEYIAIPSGKNFIKLTKIRDLVETLISMDEDLLEALDDEISRIDTSKEIKYGIKSYTCPSCKKVHKDMESGMDQMLFTLSQVRGMMRSLKRKKKQDAKKLANGTK